MSVCVSMRGKIATTEANTATHAAFVVAEVRERTRPTHCVRFVNFVLKEPFLCALYKASQNNPLCDTTGSTN